MVSNNQAFLDRKKLVVSEAKSLGLEIGTVRSNKDVEALQQRINNIKNAVSLEKQLINQIVQAHNEAKTTNGVVKLVLPAGKSSQWYIDLFQQLPDNIHITVKVHAIRPDGYEIKGEHFNMHQLYSGSMGSDANEDIVKSIDILVKPPIKFKTMQKPSGDGFQEDILEYEDEDVFIPTGTGCFFKCLLKAGVCPEKVAECIKQNHVGKGSAVSSTNLKLAREIIGVDIKVLNRRSDNRWQYIGKAFTEDTIVLSLVDPAGKIKTAHCTGREWHYILWKNPKKIPTHPDLANCIRLCTKKLSCVSFAYTAEQLYVTPKKNNARIYTYAWDCETIGCGFDRAEPYACTFLNTAIFNADCYRTEEEIRSSRLMPIFEGKQCIRDMITHLFEQYSKVAKPTILYLYAHNGAAFDNFIAIDASYDIQWKSILKTGRGIIELKATYKNVTIKLRDSRCHATGSLAKLCSNFNVPEKYTKGSFPHELINWDNWQELKPEWGPYLQNDVISLAYIINKLNTAYNQIGGSDINSYITSSSLAWKQYLYNGGKATTYLAPEVKDFIGESVWGGRVICAKKGFICSRWNEILMNYQNNDLSANAEIFPTIEENDHLIVIDANSLYPSAMSLNKMPTGGARYLEANECEDVLYDDHFAILKVSITCPKNAYIPILPRRLRNTALQYDCDDLEGTYGTPELRQAISLGYKITKYHEGIIFDQCDDSFKSYIARLYSQRQEARDANNQELADAIKTILVSIYGKTIQHDISTKQSIVSKEKAQSTLACGVIPKKCFELVNGQIVLEKKLKSPIGSMPRQIGAACLSYSKVIMNKALIAMDGVFNKENAPYYGDTDSWYVRGDQYSDMEKAGLIGDELGQFKNDYGDKMYIVYSIFIASKIKLCICMNKAGELIVKHSWKGRNLNHMEKDPIGMIKIYEDFYNTETCDIDKNIWTRSLENGVHPNVNVETTYNRVIYREDDKEDGYYYPFGYDSKYKPPVEEITEVSNKLGNTHYEIPLIQKVINKEKKVVLLTGGPGTGKSFIIKNQVIANLKQNYTVIGPTHQSLVGYQSDKSITVASLRGARPVTDYNDKTYFVPKNFVCCGASACECVLNDTIVKEAWKGIEIKFKKNPGLVIIDEFSMIPVDIILQIYRACLKYNSGLIIVGDINQLEPIGAKGITESVLQLMDGFAGIMRLTKNFRANGEEVAKLYDLALENPKIALKMCELRKANIMPWDLHCVNKGPIITATNAARLTHADKFPIKTGYPGSNVTFRNNLQEGKTSPTEIYTIRERGIEEELEITGIKLKLRYVTLIIEDSNHNVIKNIKVALNRTAIVKMLKKAELLKCRDFRDSIMALLNEYSYNYKSADSTTTHSCQGATYDNIYVDIVDMLNAGRWCDNWCKLVYTAISRGKNIYSI